MDLGNPELWAEAGGILGLVIFGSFVITITSWVMLARKDNKHSDFISKLIDEDRQERKEDRREHSDTTNRLSDAISELTNELKRKY
jgi:hypothetical protein